MTSVADQSVEELGGRLSVLSRQKSDHIELNRLLEALQGSRGMEQRRVLLKIYRLVFPHAFAEESVLWPVMRRALPDGGDLTLEVEREHQEVNELVQRLETMSDEDPERAAVLDRLIEVLREDVRDEEDVLFPRLQAVVSRTELRLLGVLWELVRRIAPTRAHPVVARRPPGNVIAALPLSAIDRLRDGTDFVLTRAEPSRVVLGPVSTALRGTSHAVEKLPIMRQGEDPSTRFRGERPGVPWGTIIGATGAMLALLALVRNRRN